MKLKLHRIALKDTYTIGKLYINDKYFCDTVEDKVRDKNKNGKFDNGEYKIPHQTAIPYGSYQVIVNTSPKFKRELPRLLNVPHFEGILIHRGLSADSSSGCIIVGENKVKGGVINSAKYELELTKILKETQKKGEKITIEIV